MTTQTASEAAPPASSPVPATLVDLFLRNPWMDDGIVSRVFENTEGKLLGFFGAVPRRMSIQGETIRLAFADEPNVSADAVEVELSETTDIRQDSGIQPFTGRS